MLSNVTLNKTDLTVSQLCYGTNQFGTAISQPAADVILDRFAELGGNFVDTARSYGDWIPDAPKGVSERTIGSWLKSQKRTDFVIATKGGFFDMRVGDYRNRVNPTDIASDLDESLDHLGVDTIDFYWLHMDNPATPVGELVDCLNEAKAAGKIRWFGASNWTDTRVLEANAYASAHGKTGFVAVEPFWGLAKPHDGNALQQGYQLYFEDHGGALKEAGLAIIPYCAQSRGYFGMLEKGEDAVPDALKGFYDNPINNARFAAAKAVAQRHGATVPEIVLAYLVNQPQQVIPIFGASTPARIEESVKAAAITLSAAELVELRAT